MDYQKAIPGKAEAITNALKAEDWPAYTVEVHALKSLSKQIGASELGYMAAELEKAGNERNIEFIRQYTEPMLSKYRRFRYDEQQTVLLEKLKTEVGNIDIDKCDKIIDEWKSLL